MVVISIPGCETWQVFQYCLPTATDNSGRFGNNDLQIGAHRLLFNCFSNASMAGMKDSLPHDCEARSCSVARCPDKTLFSKLLRVPVIFDQDILQFDNFISIWSCRFRRIEMLYFGSFIPFQQVTDIRENYFFFI